MVVWVLGLILLAVIHQLLAVNLPTVMNMGVAFGFLDQRQWNLVLISLVLVFGIVKRGRFGWKLMLAGGAVNYWDRLLFGYVRDYWSFAGGKIYNNINDWVVMVGLVVLIYQWRKR